MVLKLNQTNTMSARHLQLNRKEIYPKVNTTQSAGESDGAGGPGPGGKTASEPVGYLGDGWEGVSFQSFLCVITRGGKGRQTFKEQSREACPEGVEWCPNNKNE